MPDLKLITRAIDYIEDNLREAITVADMANAVSYSLYHFCRMFNVATHHTPYNYLMRRRLSKAAQALLGSNQRIIEVALDFQFNNPETFSRAFKRVFGIQPSQLRRQNRIDSWQLMPKLTLAHLQQIDKGAYLRPVLDEKAGFQVAGLMALVKDDLTIVSELWALLAQTIHDRDIPDRSGTCYGMRSRSATWTPSTAQGSWT